MLSIECKQYFCKEELFRNGYVFLGKYDRFFVSAYQENTDRLYAFRDKRTNQIVAMYDAGSLGYTFARSVEKSERVCMAS
jgi:hypothetical protein